MSTPLLKVNSEESLKESAIFPNQKIELLTQEQTNHFYLLREKSVHIVKAARSATIANVLAPLLCIPMFKDEVTPNNLAIWLAYMFIAVTVRSLIVYSLAYQAEKISAPKQDLRKMSFALGIVGLGWGLGWVLMAPELLMVNRMIYVYMTTAAMISSMFAYSVNKESFFAFTLPIMIPSLTSVMWSVNFFPWPFTLGLASLYIVVLSIAKNFAKTFEESVSLRFRNERLYEELADERDQSVAANVAKSKFIAVASHDLRQPMHALNVYLGMVNFDNLPTGEKRSLIKIKGCISTLNGMFESLLNISKLDADVMRVNNRPFRLSELAHTINEYVELKTLNNELVFNVDFPDVIVRGDKLILQQIILNLISNSIQYTRCGEVRLLFEIHNEQLSFSVIDTGCGIAESEQPLIYEQFYRADATRSLHDGLGLGLSIVKRLCQLIEAEINLRSEWGKGSSFTIHTTFYTSDSSEVSFTNPAMESVDNEQILHNKYIGVIEDNPIVVEAYRHTLSSKGAQVIVLSEDIENLTEQLEDINHLDCILSDYRLSHTTGDFLIQRIRENFNKDIPAVIVTADTSPSHINLFSKLNAQVLHKPVSFHEIAIAIEKMMVVPT